MKKMKPVRACSNCCPVLAPPPDLKQVRFEELKRTVSDLENTLRKERILAKDLQSKLEKANESTNRLEELEREKARFIKGLQDKVAAKVKELLPLKEALVLSEAELETAKGKTQAALKLLRDKKAELQSEFDQEKSGIGSELAALEAKLNHKEEKLKPIYEALAAEQATTAGIKQETSALEAQIAEYESQEKEHGVERVGLTDQLHDLQSKVETAQYELLEAQACEEKFEEWERLTADEVKVTQEMSDLKSQVQTTKQLSLEAKRKRTELQSLIQQLEIENNAADAKVAEIEAVTSHVNSQAKVIFDAHAAANAELTALKTQLQETENCIETTSQNILEIEGFSVQQADLLLEFREAVGMVREELNPLKAESEDLRVQNTSQISTIESLTSELNSQKSVLASKAEEMSSLEAKIAALERAPKVAPPPSSPCVIY